MRTSTPTANNLVPSAPPARYRSHLAPRTAAHAMPVFLNLITTARLWAIASAEGTSGFLLHTSFLRASAALICSPHLLPYASSRICQVSRGWKDSQPCFFKYQALCFVPSSRFFQHGACCLSPVFIFFFCSATGQPRSISLAACPAANLMAVASNA